MLNVVFEWRSESSLPALRVARYLVVAKQTRYGPGLRRRRDLARDSRVPECIRGPPTRRRRGDRVQRRPISRHVLQYSPASDTAMRAAVDIDGGHAPHEGL